MRTTITIECEDGKQFALGSILNRENLPTILPFIELLIEVVDFNSEELSKIRNRPELTRCSDKTLCFFEHRFLSCVALQM